MRIPRVALPDSVDPGETVVLPPAEGRHLVVVLRRGVGDRVILLSSNGASFEGVIRQVERGAAGPPRVSPEVSVEVLAASPSPAVPLLSWRIAVAPVRSKDLDEAVRLASELGLAEILPILTERTVVRTHERGGRLARWQRIANASAKQCGRARALSVASLRTFDELVAEASARREPVAGGDCPAGWIAVPGADPSEAVCGEALSTVGAAPLFLVGPEGGFTPAEVQRARQAGFRPLRLPTPVLRTPTALCLLAALGVVAGAASGAVGPAAASSPGEEAAAGSQPDSDSH